MSELIVNGIEGMVSDVHIYDFVESIRASKYPMAVDPNKSTPDITKTTKALGSCSIGEGHDNFLNGIRVAFDLTLSNKAWVEAERYHFFDFVSSQSTMHRITKFDFDKQCNEYITDNTKAEMKRLIAAYNENPTVENYLTALYNNPSGFKLTARMTTNYRQLKTIYYQRRNHRLPEWKTFCSWIEELPYFKELVLKAENWQEWISVKDRLPDNKEYDWVLAQVVEDNGFMHIPTVMEYRQSKNDWFEETYGWLSDHNGAFTVTHWMPLPEPPKGE